MSQELLLEIGCEELPASWLLTLTEALEHHFTIRLTEHRLNPKTVVETYATPRRLTLRIEKLASQQLELEQTIVGPPVSASFGSNGEAMPAALGFARKHGVEVSDLSREDTSKGEYLVCRRQEPCLSAIAVLPSVLAATLRDLPFPRTVSWDAFLDDGRGELPFGRPIRWVLFLYDGNVIPFSIFRSEIAKSDKVKEIRSDAVTYGHRFLSRHGNPGEAIEVDSFKSYQRALSENFVILDAKQRSDAISGQLDFEISRLKGQAYQLPKNLSRSLDEVPGLVEYPSVVSGSFSEKFLALPEEVLVTAMVSHHHFYPVGNVDGSLKPVFLSVTNSQPDTTRTIARNSEHVITARLRDAQFFWEADRDRPLADRVDGLSEVLFHKQLGSYRDKADRVSRLAEWIADVAFGSTGAGEFSKVAGRLSKTDLTTQMVREFTELQGTMGGIYAREEEYPEEIWKSIYYHYLPVGVEADAAPSPEELGVAAVPWAAVSLADKIDTIVSLFSVGEYPTGSRDPFGLRRQAHGVIRTLVDLPALTNVDVSLSLADLVGAALDGTKKEGIALERLSEFFLDRVRHLFKKRQFRYDEINAIAGREPTLDLIPLDLFRRLTALQSARKSKEFESLAVLFKRVKNITREFSLEAAADKNWRKRLPDPAELELLQECDRLAPLIKASIVKGDYNEAFLQASGLRVKVDKFFSNVFVMVNDDRVRQDRLCLMAEVRDLILQLGDISEIVSEDG